MFTIKACPSLDLPSGVSITLGQSRMHIVSESFQRAWSPGSQMVYTDRARNNQQQAKYQDVRRRIMKIAVIDGQGGGIGKSIIERIRKIQGADFEIIALGTNSLATTGMIRSGAKTGATGENAIVVTSGKVDVIMGPISIIIANSIMGEITPAMALAVADSQAVKLLIPLNRCNVEVAGTAQFNINELLDFSVEELMKLSKGMRE